MGFSELTYTASTNLLSTTSEAVIGVKNNNQYSAVASVTAYGPLMAAQIMCTTDSLKLTWFIFLQTTTSEGFTSLLLLCIVTLVLS